MQSKRIEIIRIFQTFIKDYNNKKLKYTYTLKIKIRLTNIKQYIKHYNSGKCAVKLKYL